MRWIAISFVLLCFQLHAGVSIGAATQKGYTETKYPIVLVHGMFGYDNILGLDYFHGIPHALTKDGATVYVASVSNSNNDVVRGEQLLRQVKEILAINGADKVNLVGHSQGSPTSRYVAAVAPHLVASVTSIGGVNKGTDWGDALFYKTGSQGATDSDVSVQVISLLAKLTAFMSGAAALPHDAHESLRSQTSKASLAFSQSYPEGVPRSACGEGDHVGRNGVRYYSWSGTQPISNIFDPSDPVMFALSLLADEDNDGMVPRCSSRLGKVIRDNYRMNHMDEINGLMGLHDLFETDPVTLYRQHANRLQKQGL